jgi:MFS family permease
MLTAIAPVRSLLLSIFVMMAGSGFMSTLVGLRLTAGGLPAVLVGAVATAYFVGLAVGALKAGLVISSVGHIRAFAAFVSLLSATTLAYALVQHPLVWAALRFADGLCVAGVYVCLESWLNARAEPRRRGTVLAAYMIALYAGQALGQFLLNLSDAKPSAPFVVASMLISLAVIPVALTRGASPAFGEAPMLSIPHLFAISPLGVAGAATTGLMMGGFYGLGAVYARLVGLDVAATASFMSAVIFGGVALQWPVGWLSDKFDRRRVITLSLAGVAAISAGVALSSATGVALLALGGLFGGLCFALYPLCVAHTNDHLDSAQRVAASGGLVMIYSLGAAVGPVAGGAAMSAFGARGLFLFFALCALAGLAFAIWRHWSSAPVPPELQQDFQTLPRTTPMAAALDARGDDTND